MLESSENYERITHKFTEHGISVNGAKIDIAKMQGRKEKIVAQLTGGVAFLFRKNKIEWLKGHGKFVSGGDKYTIEVKEGVNASTVEAKHVIVATGSTARQLPGIEVDNKTICDNVGALAFDAVPAKLGVIGAGVVGLELGSVWRRLGSEVTILEALPAFLGAADDAVAKEAWKRFVTEQKLNIQLGVKIGKVATGKKGVTVEYESADGKQQKVDCDKLVVSVGRVPNTKDLGAEAVGLKIDARGFIEVDAQCRTNLPNVYAAGDVVRGPMLAHKGMDEGVMVAEVIAGQATRMNLDTIPWVIYTSPEIAWVGKTEQQLKKDGVAYRAGQFSFAHNGRALGLGETEGFVKILADTATDRVLGVHIVCSRASELIAEAVMAMEFDASAEDIARICHAHPSLSEVVHEAAMAVDKRALHG